MVLADKPEMQEKLRKELLTLDENPSLCVLSDCLSFHPVYKSFASILIGTLSRSIPPTREELNGLTYLEAFVKEGLRVYPPVFVLSPQHASILSSSVDILLRLLYYQLDLAPSEQLFKTTSCLFPSLSWVRHLHLPRRITGT